MQSNVTLSNSILRGGKAAAKNALHIFQPYHNKNGFDNIRQRVLVLNSRRTRKGYVILLDPSVLRHPSILRLNSNRGADKAVRLRRQYRPGPYTQPTRIVAPHPRLCDLSAGSK
jgi:hypothetical protein